MSRVQNAQIAHSVACGAQVVCGCVPCFPAASTLACSDAGRPLSDCVRCAAYLSIKCSTRRSNALQTMPPAQNLCKMTGNHGSFQMTPHIFSQNSYLLAAVFVNFYTMKTTMFFL
jgi:hypothetical protein